MQKMNQYGVSEFLVKWLDEANCLVGFTITYQDGTIENKLQKCTVNTYQQVMNELKEIREKYLQKIS